MLFHFQVCFLSVFSSRIFRLLHHVEVHLQFSASFEAFNDVPATKYLFRKLQCNSNVGRFYDIMIQGLFKSYNKQKNVCCLKDAQVSVQIGNPFVILIVTANPIQTAFISVKKVLYLMLERIKTHLFIFQKVGKKLVDYLTACVCTQLHK